MTDTTHTQKHYQLTSDQIATIESARTYTERYGHGRFSPEMQNVFTKLANDELTISYFGTVIDRTQASELTLMNKCCIAMNKVIEAELSERKSNKI